MAGLQQCVSGSYDKMWGVVRVREASVVQKRCHERIKILKATRIKHLALLYLP